MPTYVLKFTSSESATEMEVQATGRDVEHVLELVKKALGDELEFRSAHLESDLFGHNLLPDVLRRRAWNRILSGERPCD